MKPWLGVLLAAVACSMAFAKRVPAPVVPPITHEGVVYNAQGDGRTACVVANDEKSGKELWKVEVYRVEIDPAKEADVQFIYIKGMVPAKDKLLIEDEAGRCYRLDLMTQKVQGVSCKKYGSLKPATSEAGAKAR